MPKSPLKLVDKPSDEGVLVKESTNNEEEAKPSTRSGAKPQGSRGTNSGTSLSDPAHDLLTLQTPKKKSPADQFIFQRHTPMPTEAFGHAESPSLDAKLALTDSETESDNEGQAGPNPGNQDEGQAGPNPGDQDEGQAGSNMVILWNLNLNQVMWFLLDQTLNTWTWRPLMLQLNKNLSKWMMSLPQLLTQIFRRTSSCQLKIRRRARGKLVKETSDAPSPVKRSKAGKVTKKRMPKSPLKLVDEPSDEGVLVEEPAYNEEEANLQQKGWTNKGPDYMADLILVKRIGKLEQHMADLIQKNLALEERLDKQGTRLYNLENLYIPHKVSQAVDEIVTDAVDWAMQAPLRARFKDLPTVDMKEILKQRMFEDNSYKAQDVHNDLYEALQKSLELDYSNQRLADQEQARKKRRKRRDVPRNPSGSPPS
ncbi:hypothetical protein Tco_0185341 [Tanacetum coccineum]